MSTGGGERVCPSSTLGHATHLLGVVGPNGRVHYVSPALPITPEFSDRVSAAGSPERRFRFAGPCVESGCQQWTGSRCGVIDAVVAQAETAVAGGIDGLDTPLRPCPVRRECRWFAQQGAAACHVCPLVATDMRPVPATSA